MTANLKRLSLRERKKRQTRQAIVAVATHLFAENGYVETTLVEIAEGAEIAPSTFFNYFPSKADIVFAPIDMMVESTTTRIVNRPLGESVIAAVLAWAEEDLPDVELPVAEVLRSLPEIIAAVPELRSAERLRLANLQDTLATAFALNLGERTDGLRAHVMATIALRGMLNVWESWYQRQVADTHADLAEVPAPSTEHLERALMSGLTAIESLPTHRRGST